MKTMFTSLPTVGGRPIRLRFDTDSPHLAHFFALNWPPPDTSNDTYDARIVARRRTAVNYALPALLDEARWYCPESRQVWITGSEYYGNVKITVRGLCSELAPADEMFIHGCAMLVDEHGVILSGTSGSGKTTLTAALRRAKPETLRVVNDDWGPLSLASLNLQYTGEQRLHMKYSSVQTLAPSLAPTPKSHPSENFRGDSTDPRARLMISREDVFGTSGIADSARVALFAVVSRAPDQQVSLRTLTARDIDQFESGSYSAFYGRTERFLNGSLFLTELEQQRAMHCQLLKSARCVLVNNVGPPAETASRILEELVRT